MRQWVSNYTWLYLCRRSVRTRKILLGGFMAVAIVGDASAQLVDIAREMRGEWREFTFNINHMDPR